MKTALTIAGSDSSGGAGIQADIKTMIANGVYAMSAITALTAQNTTGVTAIMEVTPEFLGEELDNIFTDIYPDAVKIGMVSSSTLIGKIADKLEEYPSLQTTPSFLLKDGNEEKERIIRALVQTGGNRETAAGLLGVSRTTLYNRMKEYGIIQKKKGK